jgi:hypothetical protein
MEWDIDIGMYIEQIGSLAYLADGEPDSWRSSGAQ